MEVEKTGSVVIATVIGTVSLLIMVGIVGTYYTMYYASLQKEVLCGKLQDLSNQVSSDISDLVTLGSVSENDQFLVKRLTIPRSIDTHFYNLFVVRTENSLIVLAQEFLQPSVYGEAYLPWSTHGSIALYNGSDPGITNPRVTPRMSVTSISSNLVIWYLKIGGRITFGLGAEV